MPKPTDSAFPRAHDTGSDGMTIRQWYAGQALTGMRLVAMDEKLSADVISGKTLPNQIQRIALDAVADAFSYADMMIAFENKERK